MFWSSLFFSSPITLKCIARCISTLDVYQALHIHSRVIRLIPICCLIIILWLTNNDTPLNDQRFHGSKRLSARHTIASHSNTLATRPALGLDFRPLLFYVLLCSSLSMGLYNNRDFLIYCLLCNPVTCQVERL